MCWNESVSINTFLFGVFVLILIYITNHYHSNPDYKLKEFNNPYTYFFMMSFITMQLYEYLLWKYLNNRIINQIVSILGLLLLSIQPIASLTMLNDITLRNKLITIYSIPACIYILYQLSINHVHTSISKLGHLKWNWTSNTKLQTFIIYMFYLFFLYISLFINKYYSGIIISLPLFIIMYYFFYKDGSAGSLWCLSINTVMLYYFIRVILNYFHFIFLSYN